LDLFALLILLGPGLQKEDMPVHCNASWLENDDLPHAWKIIKSGLCSDITRCPKVLNVFQAPDSGSPTLPLDVFKDKNGVRNRPANIATARARFKSELSAKKGCRHYVSGALHEKIPDTALVLLPETEGDYDILVAIQKRRRFDPSRKPRVGAIPDPAEYDIVESDPSTQDLSMAKRKCSAGDNTKTVWTWFVERELIVKVQFVCDGKDTVSGQCLEDLMTLGEKLQLNTTTQAQVGKGDKGSMFALGSKVNDSAHRMRHMLQVTT
jgi:hypothetical protein